LNSGAREPITLDGPTGGPVVLLLDAKLAGLDDRGLRLWAREQAAPRRGSHTSRSYRYPYALVAWHTAPVGIDIDQVERFRPEFLDAICTPDERALPLPDDVEAYVASLYCSKEALSKAEGNPLRYDPSKVGSPMFWPERRSGPWRAAELALPSGHRGWVCWRSMSSAR
jgi:hypothetical protein